MAIEDLGAVFALGERLFTADRWPYLYRSWEEHELLEYYLSDGETCLVAEQGGELAGFAIGCVIEKRRSSWVYGYLGWLGVAPERQHGQVALRLMDRLRAIFLDNGVRMMLVDTAAANTRAMRFFHRYGFGQDQEHIYMSMNLSQGGEPQRRSARPNRTRGPVHLPKPPTAPADDEPRD